MSDPNLNSRLELANRIARRAGQLTLEYFQRDGLEVDLKEDGTPLTIADRNAELFLRQEIQAAFPDDAIVGEEFEDRPGSSGFGWILDPIDGTKSFIRGVPLYGTMVAVERLAADAPESSDQQPARQAVIGSVYFPGLDEGIYAAVGQGAFKFRGTAAPQPARVSTRAQLGQAVLLTTSTSAFEKRSAGAAYRKLANQFFFDRTWGDVYGYYLVATGRAEAMIDPELSVWDAAAVQPIIQEAGGTYSDWSGAPDIAGGDAVGSNGLVHAAILQALQSAG